MSATAPASRFVDLPGRRLHLLEWGAAAAPPLVLVHGIRDHAHSWDFLAAELAPRFRVIAPDLRGHGDSDWTGAYDVPDYVRDLTELLAALDCSPVSLAGHSLGGAVALRYAASFPERVARLCLIEGVELPIIRDQRRAPRAYPVRLREWIENETARAGRAPRFYATLAEAEARMTAAHPTIAPEILAHLTRHGVVEEVERGFRWKYDNAARFRAPEDAHGIDLDDILPAVTCPVLLVYGAKSWIPVPPAHRLARLRQHRVVLFTDASHWPHLEWPAQLLGILRDFLDGPDASAEAGPNLTRSREVHDV